MAQVVTPFEALKLGVTRAGGQSATARICGVSQTAVWKWLQSGKRLPAEHVLVMADATGISPHLFRPDIYPVSLVIEEPDYTERCGPLLSRGASYVVCDRAAETQRKGVA
ncbi:transcriptional regulator [Novosphingobium colocasiae]|uniref:transcriptional regulator n=1 Tax=Novosphingobium colocasiae TaxID=1256513 RepID=UPI0035AE0C35